MKPLRVLADEFARDATAWEPWRWEQLSDEKQNEVLCERDGMRYGYEKGYSAALSPPTPEEIEAAIQAHRGTHDHEMRTALLAFLEARKGMREAESGEILTDAEIAEWNHADCGDDCQSKAIEKLVCRDVEGRKR